MALPRYTLGTGKSKKKVKKPNSVRERIALLMGNKTTNGNGNAMHKPNTPPPQMLFSPKVPKVTPRPERYTRLHPEDRALLVEGIALLKRSIWGEPEIVSEEPEEAIEEITNQEATEDAPVLREDEVEADQPA